MVKIDAFFCETKFGRIFVTILLLLLALSSRSEAQFFPNLTILNYHLLK